MLKLFRIGTARHAKKRLQHMKLEDELETFRIPGTQIVHPRYVEDAKITIGTLYTTKKLLDQEQQDMYKNPTHYR